MSDRTMSLADSAWLHLERPENLMMVTGLLLLDRNPDRANLETILRERLLCYDRFRMRAVEPAFGLGPPRWESDPTFELNNHLRYESMPKAGELELLTKVSEMMSQPLPRSQPLWDLLILEDLCEGAAVLVRLHHAIADGIALMRVLLDLAETEEATERDLAFSDERTENTTVGAWEAARLKAHELLQRGHDILLHPSQIGQGLERGWDAGKTLTRVMALPPDQENVLRGKLGCDKVVAVSGPLAMEPIKDASKRIGCTVNDLLMALMAGALGATLRRRQDVAEDLVIRAVVPVDLRQGRLHELGNQFGLVFLELPVGDPDLNSRLAKVRRAMDELKGSTEALVTFELLSAVGILPLSLEQNIIEWFGNKATAVLTNLRGPEQPIYLGAARMTGLMYWVPQSGHLGLGLSMISYAGQMRVGVASDAGLLPQPQQLVDDFQRSLEEALTRL